MGSKQKKWFHPNINGAQAEEILRKRGSPGSFIVRPSQSTPGDFAISVLRGKQIVHVQIQNGGDCYDLYGGEQFATLSELVDFYICGGELLEADGTPIIIKKACVCTDPTNERWFHGNLSGQEAERLLMDKGVDGSFLVRASQRKPGDFVLSVRCGQKVSHTIIEAVGEKFQVGRERFDHLSAVVESVRSNPMTDPFTKKKIVLSPVLTTRVRPRKLEQIVSQLGKEPPTSTVPQSGFTAEFNRLQGMQHDHEGTRRIGKLPPNEKKNRYHNIVPYDETRVKLTPKSSMAAATADKPRKSLGRFFSKKKKTAKEDGDYINASYITESGRMQPSYIATQGPLKHTTSDFWTMVWVHSTKVIAMLTKLEEGGKEKCYQYFPDLGKKNKMESGLSVECVDEYKAEQAVLRRLELSDGTTKRDVFHFQFDGWPESPLIHPDSKLHEDLARFICSVRQKCLDLAEADIEADMGPVVVHCSSGLGRTGVFVCVDMLLAETESKGVDAELDIASTVNDARQQRAGLIQKEDQYVLVYRTLLTALGHTLSATATGQASKKRTSYAQLSFMPSKTSETYGKPLPAVPEPL
eukprot:m.180852 g.180852  ORF g.180852 m.180852 type:complete len:581 (-) comp18023_c1_seq5:373-2115(-)